MRFHLPADRMPTAWFNALPRLPEPMQPPLHPATREPVGPDDAKDGESRENYRERRRKADPDLWIVELDIADAPRLVAEWGALT